MISVEDRGSERSQAAQTPSRGGRSVRRRWITSLRRTAEEKLWPVTLLFTTLAVTATVTSDPGDLIGDNRFEQFLNPPRRLAESLGIWDGSRGLGRVREDFWPGTTTPLGLLRGLGLSPALSQKIWLAMVLVVLGVGTVAVLRLFRPRIGVAHVLAGLGAMFGAYSATFLVPSNLSFQVALAPWFIVALWRGATGCRPWKWAAVFALLVFAAGNADLPGLIFSMVPLVPVAIYLVFVDRSVRFRELVGWLARAGLLCVAISAAALAKTAIAASTFDQRLAETEAPRVSSITSSWSESFRGLGNWLSYFQQGNQLEKPQGAPYFLNPLVAMVTFVPGIVAVAVLWRSRWRSRILFVWIAIFSLVLMVGAFPLASPTPAGSVFLDLVTNVGLLAAFRNTYKAGGGVVIGVAILFGVGVEMAARRAGPTRSAAHRAVIGGGLAVLLVIATPFWTGRLFDSTHTLHGVPSYWNEAFTYLDSQPVDGRVLIVPPTSRTQYRWGWVGDDIFDEGLTKDHAIATGIPLSTQLPTNLIEAISSATSDPVYEAGSLAPVLRRLGISQVVLRNDLDWQAMGRPRPARYAGLRADPDFHLAATFGDVGENTVVPEDRSPDGEVERQLPPVEVYALNDPQPELRAAPDQAPLLVSGDGAAWTALAGSGLLDGTGPLEYTGSLDSSALSDALEAGSPVVITDTNRRRLRVVVDHEPDYSYLLSESQDLDRPTQSLFEQPRTQSRAWSQDAVAIALSGNPRTIDGSEPWNQPSKVFDGDPKTQWTMGQGQQPEGRTFRVQLRGPKTVDRIKVDLAEGLEPGTSLTQLKLKFSSGPDVLVNLTGPSTELGFDARTTSFVDVEMLGVVPSAPKVGFSDVTFPGLDLREFVEVPADVMDRAETDAVLRGRVASASVSYVFTRDQAGPFAQAAVGATRVDPKQVTELSMLRRFTTVGDRQYELSGSIHVDPAASTDQGECRSVGLTVDGSDVPITLTDRPVGGTGSDVAQWHGCGPVTLSAGAHQLVTSDPEPIDRLVIASPEAARPVAPIDGSSDEPTVAVVSRSATSAHVVVSGPGSVTLWSGGSFDPRWVASVDGGPDIEAVALDTQSGWVIPGSGTRDVVIRFRAARLFDVGLVVTAATVVLCLWLALRRGRHDRSSESGMWYA